MDRKTKNIAVCTAMLYDGAVNNPSLVIDLFKVGGFVGLARTLTDYAYLIAEFMETAEFLEHDHAGVFEYEVVEELGVWFALNLQPTPEQFQAELMTAWRNFKDQ